MPSTWTDKQLQVIRAADDAIYRPSSPIPPPWDNPGAKPVLLAAMVVAAWHETRLGLFDGGDGGRSWGPWQANTAAGVGVGHAPADLSRPEYSAPLMLFEMVRQDRLTGKLSRALAEGTAFEFVATWNAEVERPGVHEGRRLARDAIGRLRAVTVEDWWGATAHLPALNWTPIPRRES